MLVSVQVNRADVERFGNLAYKQLPFATARALTWTAQQAQGEVKESLPKHFKLRNSFVKNSVRISPATKASQQSEVGSTIDFMSLHETGGVKRPRGHYLAVPVNVKNGSRGKIGRRDRPKQLLAKGNYSSTKGRNNRIFKIDSSTPNSNRHGLPYGIYSDNGSAVRKGKRKRTSGIGLTLLYALIPVGDIDERFELRETTSNTVAKQFDSLFAKSLSMALASAR